MRTARALAAALLAAFLTIVLPAAAPQALAQESERLMLSGTGVGDAVDWDFSVSGGRRAGEKATIPVPSQWEQHGFGAYNYGHDHGKAQEEGRYRRRFEVPAAWRGRTVDLVFEGVMTDAEARVNGRPAGDVHRGGFYRFRYDVTELLRFGEENSLEVTVRKHSADESVNAAERAADYWVFGGIYRPVYLEARPPESIDQIAIAAGHDGRLTISARLRGVVALAWLTARVETLGGERIHGPVAVAAEPGAAGSGAITVELATRVEGARSWSAESPDLYRLVVELERSGRVLHRRALRFGFRSVEVRRDGLFVNGRRVRLKGVNRQAFWPASGRTLDRGIDVSDAELIQRMNMNAVRSAHYPPDVSFLDACDELGIYVIDELAGWHDAYSTAAGRPLVREMVERDVNHPSVILWANGNEGGWNQALDEVFAEHDPQRRAVIHPRGVFGGFDAEHYPTWSELAASLEPSSWRNRWRSLFGGLPLVMPTELLHGLYDGGSGAGLEDYWRLLRASVRGAGAFLWAFADEAVERSDRGGELDTDGDHAPDGVLGPYRELTGNYYAVREVFSPIHIAAARFEGALEVENRFDETELARCRFDWSLEDLPGSGESGGVRVLEGGTLAGPAAAPGRRGELRLPPSAAWRAADALRLVALDPAGREVEEWVLPTRDLRVDAGRLAAGGGHVEAEIEGGRLVLRSAGAGAELDLATGELRFLQHAGGGRLAFAGPRPAAGDGSAPVAVRHHRQGSAFVLEARYARGLLAARWTFFPSGWLRLSYRYASGGSQDYFGVRFATPREDVSRLRWLGGGPARVWKNRLAGARLGVWTKPGRSTPAAAPHEPKLEGFYAGVYWAELATLAGDLTIVFESPDLYLGLFAPPFPDDARSAVAAAPQGVSFLHGISAIGTKFHSAPELGPASRRDVAQGLYHGVVWLRLAGH